MAGNCRNQPDFVTQLRAVYALGQTPFIFDGMLPKSVDELTPETRDRCLHYATFYKTFMRPILPRCRVYHHAPVSAAGGVESGGWFAMEFMSPDKEKGWATVVRLSGNVSDALSAEAEGIGRRPGLSRDFRQHGQSGDRVRRKADDQWPADPATGGSALGAGTFRGFRTRRLGTQMTVEDAVKRLPWEGKGDRHPMCAAPCGPFRQMVPVPFFP